MKDVNDGANAVAKYEYDGRNRRTVSKSYTAGTLTETRHAYYTNGWQNIEERLGTNTTADTQHVWGIRYIDELVCRDDATSSPMRRIYACQDANFNMTAMAEVSGAVAQRFDYESYGKDSVRNGAWAAASDAYSWRVRFQGLPLDPATLLYLARNRYYHPRLGGWLRRDPINYVDGSNMVVFVRNNPIRRTDAFGLQAAPVLTQGKAYTSKPVQGGFGVWTMSFTPGAPSKPGFVGATGIITYTPDKGKMCKCVSIDLLQLVTVDLNGKAQNGAGIKTLFGYDWADPVSGWAVDQDVGSLTPYYTKDEKGQPAALPMVVGSITDQTSKPATMVDNPSDDATSPNILTWHFVVLAICTGGIDQGVVYDAAAWSVTKSGKTIGTTIFDPAGTPAMQRAPTGTKEVVAAFKAWNDHTVWTKGKAVIPQASAPLNVEANEFRR